MKTDHFLPQTRDKQGINIRPDFPRLFATAAIMDGIVDRSLCAIKHVANHLIGHVIRLQRQQPCLCQGYHGFFFGPHLNNVHCAHNGYYMDNFGFVKVIYRNFRIFFIFYGNFPF